MSTTDNEKDFSVLRDERGATTSSSLSDWYNPYPSSSEYQSCLIREGFDLPVLGCGDLVASNYNFEATVDDGSYEYAIDGCPDGDGETLWYLDSDNDGSGGVPEGTITISNTNKHAFFGYYQETPETIVLFNKVVDWLLADMDLQNSTGCVFTYDGSDNPGETEFTDLLSENIIIEAQAAVADYNWENCDYAMYLHHYDRPFNEVDAADIPFLTMSNQQAVDLGIASAKGATDQSANYIVLDSDNGVTTSHEAGLYQADSTWHYSVMASEDGVTLVTHVDALGVDGNAGVVLECVEPAGYVANADDDCDSLNGFDQCGVCGGDNAACSDVCGVANGDGAMLWYLDSDNDGSGGVPEGTITISNTNKHAFFGYYQETPETIVLFNEVVDWLLADIDLQNSTGCVFTYDGSGNPGETEFTDLLSENIIIEAQAAVADYNWENCDYAMYLHHYDRPFNEVDAADIPFLTMSNQQAVDLGIASAKGATDQSANYIVLDSDNGVTTSHEAGLYQADSTWHYSVMASEDGVTLVTHVDALGVDGNAGVVLECVAPAGYVANADDDCDSLNGFDQCGVCGGDNTACADVCGVTNGDGETLWYLDSDNDGSGGVPEGTITISNTNKHAFFGYYQETPETIVLFNEVVDWLLADIDLQNSTGCVFTYDGSDNPGETEFTDLLSENIIIEAQAAVADYNWENCDYAMYLHHYDRPFNEVDAADIPFLTMSNQQAVDLGIAAAKGATDQSANYIVLDSDNGVTTSHEAGLYQADSTWHYSVMASEDGVTLVTYVDAIGLDGNSGVVLECVAPAGYVANAEDDCDSLNGFDQCGVCGGDNAACSDVCGVANGDGETLWYLDSDNDGSGGVPEGTITISNTNKHAFFGYYQETPEIIVLFNEVVDWLLADIDLQNSTGCVFTYDGSDNPGETEFTDLLSENIIIEAQAAVADYNWENCDYAMYLHHYDRPFNEVDAADIPFLTMSNQQAVDLGIAAAKGATDQSANYIVLDSDNGVTTSHEAGLYQADSTWHYSVMASEDGVTLVTYVDALGVDGNAGVVLECVEPAGYVANADDDCDSLNGFDQCGVCGGDNTACADVCLNNDVDNDGLVDEFPVITLNDDAVLVIEATSDTNYEDDGADCMDAEDGSISEQVEVSGDIVNLANPGMYTLFYDCTDSDGYAAQTMTRTVVVIDAVADDVLGCTYLSATNYNVLATADDGSCVFAFSSLGDLNNDNSINILDIIELVNLVLSMPEAELKYAANSYSDINGDQHHDILDVITLSNTIVHDDDFI